MKPSDRPDILQSADIGPAAGQDVDDERLRLAIEAGQMAVFEVDAKTGALTRSAQLNKVLGFPDYASPSLEGLRAPLAPGEANRLILVAEQAVAERAPFAQAEFQYDHPQGRRWLALRARLLYEQGRLTRCVGVLFDMTAQRQAEQDVRRSEALKDAILRAALDCIVTIDEDSRVLEWNPAAQSTFGFTRDEAMGRDLCELIIPPELRKAHQDGMARFLASGEATVIGRRVEVEALDRAQRRFPVELAISPIDIAGQVHFAAYIRDISDRRAAEAALMESERRLNATQEHAFAGIGEVDATGRFIRVNGQFSNITGYSREELLRRSVWEISHPDDVEGERVLFARQMAGELPAYSLEKRYVRKTGETVWVELLASVVIGSDGAPPYGIRVVRDVSERLRWVEHQRLLINELNHRVKNTLATVQSIASQTLRAAPDTEVARHDLEERLRGLARAHDLLTRASWERADLRELVAEAIAPYAAADSDRVETDGPQLWLSPRTALALAMAIQELATNAVKYGALGDSGSVRISWELFAQAGQTHVRLCWVERGGPAVKPPSHSGFGTRLLQRNLARDLNGEVSLDFRRSGLVCTIEAPVTEQAPAP